MQAKRKRNIFDFYVTRFGIKYRVSVNLYKRIVVAKVISVPLEMYWGFKKAEKVITNGIAKCSPEDEFSIKFGADLAIKRATNILRGNILVVFRKRIHNIEKIFNADYDCKKMYHR